MHIRMSTHTLANTGLNRKNIHVIMRQKGGETNKNSQANGLNTHTYNQNINTYIQKKTDMQTDIYRQTQTGNLI